MQEIKFPDQVNAERIILKRTLPTIEQAKLIFEVIKKNRDELRPWLDWEEKILTIEDELKYLFAKEEELKKNKKFEYGIFLNNQYIGNLGIFDIDFQTKSVEIGYWLDKDHQKNGYMTEAVILVEKMLFENHGFNRIQIQCDQRNAASAAIPTKLDYVLEATLRENMYTPYFKDLRNTLIFSKLKSEYTKQ